MGVINNIGLDISMIPQREMHAFSIPMDKYNPQSSLKKVLCAVDNKTEIHNWPK